MVMGDWLGLASGVLITLVMVLWFRKITAVNVPRFRTPYFGGMLVAAVLGIAAFMLDTSWVGGVPAGLGIFLGLMFPALRLQSSQDQKTPSVRVGDPVLNFTVLDETGESFDLASMAGSPYLLKFFRGHW
jgi:hypothetical protein